MGLVTIRAVVDVSPLRNMNTLIETAPRRMADLQYKRVPASERRVRRLVAAPPNLPDLPFIWSNDPAAQARGRRGYFAKLRREGKLNKGGGRHERTGALEDATHVEFIEEENGGRFDLTNQSSAWDYVYSQKQVPSHYLTGWPQEENIIDEEAATLQHQIIDDWFAVSTGEV